MKPKISLNKSKCLFVLRCIDPKEDTVHEYFLTFVEAAILVAKSLTKSIVDTFNIYHMQRYNGALVVIGYCTGVQAQLKEFAPHAICIHFHAHILNFVLIASVKAIPDATQFFALVESLYMYS